MIGKPSLAARTALLIAVAALAALALAPAASAEVAFHRIAGFASPATPAKYNRVGILKTGARRAKNVLVLSPGTSASASYFQPLAKDIVSRLPGWQVWAVERRENRLEDQSRFNQVKAGTITPLEAFNYYLGYLDDPGITTHFQSIPTADVAYAKEWGMRTEIEDLRRVVLLAKKRGGKVVLGGHSLGGTITTAYATWNFGGRAGARGLSGLVYIDGGSGRQPLSAEQATESLNELNQPASSPWLTFGGFPAPLAGLFNTSGALGALLDPDSPSVGQAFRLLPAFLKPPVPVTNLAQYGYALDSETSPPSLIAAQAHLGRIASSGDPHGWDQAGELTPIQRYAKMFAGWRLKGLDGTAWYHPQRLTLDAGAVANGNPNPAQAVLDVRTTKGHDLSKRLQIYAFGAQLGGQRVLDGATALANQNRIPAKNLTLVNRASTYSHNDPNSASPKNDFFKYLIPFLRDLPRR
jgi:pimeloyl-ACP methyl ester carboxylesterase